MENLVKQKFKPENLECGELYLQDSFKKKLPLGAFARFRKIAR